MHRKLTLSDSRAPVGLIVLPLSLFCLVYAKREKALQIYNIQIQKGLVRLLLDQCELLCFIKF